MTSFPAADAYRNAVNQGVKKQVVEDAIAAAKQLPGGSARSTLTIAAGIVTPTRAIHAIDTEAAAASDSLTNAALANHPEGRLMRLQSVSAARVVWLEHAASGDGEFILLDGIDLPLTDPRSWVLFERVGTTWVEVDRYVADQPASSGFANLIDNSDGVINQDGDTPAGLADNSYGTDCWRVLSNGGTCNWFGAATFLPSTARGRLTVQTATNNVKFGMFGVLPSWKVRALRGQRALLSFLVAVSDARISNLKVGVAEWIGTADATQADPISAWGADGVTPTLAANWSFLNVPANLGIAPGAFPTASFVGPIEVTIGANANNLAIFIWNDDATVNNGDAIYATKLNFHLGRTLLPYEYRPRELELIACQSMYCRSHPYGVAAAANTGEVGSIKFTQATIAAGGQCEPRIKFPVSMLFVPSVTLLNPSVAANNQVRNFSAGTNWTGSTAQNITTDEFTLFATSPAGSAAGHIAGVHFAASARV